MEEGGRQGGVEHLLGWLQRCQQSSAREEGRGWGKKRIFRSCECSVNVGQGVCTVCACCSLPRRPIGARTDQAHEEVETHFCPAYFDFSLRLQRFLLSRDCSLKQHLRAKGRTHRTSALVFEVAGDHIERRSCMCYVESSLPVDWSYGQVYSQQDGAGVSSKGRCRDSRRSDLGDDLGEGDRR